MALGARRSELSEFFEIAMELAQTVGELHRRRVVHKNLSPDSILLDPKTRRTQVCDFSLASRLPQETQAPHPPASCRGGWIHLSRADRPHEPGGRLSDRPLFAGAVFYEMLTGRPPFASADPLELVHAHIAKAPPFPSRLEPPSRRSFPRSS